MYSEDLDDPLSEWQYYYSWHRPHGSLGDKSPMDRFFEVVLKTPLLEEVEVMYDASKERIQEQNYHYELALFTARCRQRQATSI